MAYQAASLNPSRNFLASSMARVCCSRETGRSSSLRTSPVLHAAKSKARPAKVIALLGRLANRMLEIVHSRKRHPRLPRDAPYSLSSFLPIKKQ